MHNIVGVALAVLALSTASVAQPPVWNVACKTDSLRVDLPRDTPVKVSYFRFLSDEQGSRSALTLQNVTDKPLRDVTLLLEFRRESEYLFTALVRAASNDTTMQTLAGIDLATVDRLPKQVLPGERIVAHGDSATTTSRCPSEIRASYIYIDSGSKLPYVYASSTVRTDPKLISFERKDENADTGIFSTSESVLVTLLVDTDGNPTVEAASTASLPVFEALKNWIHAWKFAPGTFAERRSASRIKLLLRFRKSPLVRGANWPPECYENTLCTFAIVDLFPTAASGFELWYDGVPLPAK
jgi:hypothetical protein